MNDLKTLAVLRSEQHAFYWVRANKLVHNEEFGPGQLHDGISIIELPPDDDRAITDDFSLEAASFNDGLDFLLWIILLAIILVVVIANT